MKNEKNIFAKIFSANKAVTNKIEVILDKNSKIIGKSINIENIFVSKKTKG